MSFSFRVPRGSAPSPEPSSKDGIFKRSSHTASRSANEAAVQAANDALSGAAEHGRHPDPRSGLLESHIFPVIYTKYHFEDLKFGYIQYTKEMVEKHHSMGIVLKKADIATYWVIQVRREYPDGHPLRRILMAQLDRHDIRIFWEHRSKNDAKDKKALKALNKKIEELKKQVKLLNKELARLKKEA